MNIHRRDRARLRQGNPIDINSNPESNFGPYDYIPARSELISPEPYYVYHESQPHVDHMYHRRSTTMSPDNSVVRLTHNSQPIRSRPSPSPPIATFIPSISQPASNFSSHPAAPSTFHSMFPFSKAPHNPSTDLLGSDSRTLQAPFDRVSKDSKGSAETNRWNTETDFLFSEASVMIEALKPNFPETKEYVNALDVMKINRCSQNESLDNMDELDLELRLGERPPVEKYRINKFKRGA